MANLSVIPLEQPALNDIVSNFNLSSLYLDLSSSSTVSDFADLMMEVGFLAEFTLYCSEIANSSPKETFGGSVFTNMGEGFEYLESEIRHRHVKFPHLTREEIWAIMESYGSSAQMEMSLKLFDDLENTPIDYSNKLKHKGEIIDVSTLGHKEIIKLACEVDDIDKFESLEHIRSTYIGTAPNVKLFYPEPFLASPSFIHSDLGYLHILQYQFWLWFVFIFLIVFFFVSFLCVVRWCAHRNQPRRETRGVSRSKCGDLITATVPVTWAISIIVSETTDATDVYDGFGTEEIIVGVRAYQWGWEYYYPKNVDLNYNLKPSYSTFVGNSLKYNSVYERKLGSNNVWKFYQQKVDDAIITPAHLLVFPLDNSKIFNFMNFDNIGANALKNSNAFRKIRDHSKVYKTNLVATPSTFADKYVRLNSLYFTENDLNNSFNYGLKRQHNLTSTAATTTVQSTFLDRQSMTKFLNYNLKYNTDLKATTSTESNLHSLKKGTTSSAMISTTTNLNNLFADSNTFNTENLKLLASYPNLTKEMGHNSDKKDTKYPEQSLLTIATPEYLSTRTRNESTLAMLDEAHLSTDDYREQTLYFKHYVENGSLAEKALNAICVNHKVDFDKQAPRRYSKLQAHRTNLNLSQGFNSLDSTLEQRNSSSVANSIVDDVQRRDGGWVDPVTFNKLASNRMHFTSNLPPVLSSNPQRSRLNFDQIQSKTPTINYSNVDESKKVKVSRSFKRTHKNDIPIMAGSVESSPSGLRASYWKMFWTNTNSDFRISTAVNSSLNQEFFYLPPFTNCNEYDFRNAQALEMLEDAFWENSYSGYNHADYLTSFDNAVTTFDPKAYMFLADQLFYQRNFNLNLTQRMLVTPVLRDLSTVGNFYANNIQMDDYISPANLMNTKDFAIFPILSNLIWADDSYMSAKGLTQLYANNSTLLLNVDTSFNYPQSYLSVLNNFRADFDDFSWHVDIEEGILPTPVMANQALELGDGLSFVSMGQNNNSRYPNPITLRSTAKNSIVTYAALQKVFRSRFEDGRANIRLNHFADLRVKQPLIMGSRLGFEKLLGKNKERFYNTTFYTNNTFTVLNDLASSNNSLNTYFFDFPFLLSSLSDSAHFVWFDWYTQWGMVEIQPASVAKQSLAGVQYWKKGYEYASNSTSFSAEAENYFTRISRARKNYLPLWVYTPYLYTRANVWLAESDLDQLDPKFTLTADGLILLFDKMEFFTKRLAFATNTSDRFTPTFSNSHKSTWRPHQSIQAYHANLSRLTDILTRREYLLRQYLETQNKIINLPKRLSVSPSNPLLKEIKSSFLLLDPITYNSESFREIFYHSKTGFSYFMAYNQIINWSEKVGNKFNVNPHVIQKALGLRTNGTDPLHNALLYYFLDDSYRSGRVMGKSADLYKSQYRPLKKGITNMLRLHGTGAVAMPIEIRLQILASSRDVIHSWAIPSAGIKIDCIPGYTSHRIMIFFTPGIYWGQCMEICGRYHHWMPIILYFMKRDLFFLWCTHFMSKSDFNSTWGINDRQFTDYVRFVSYDRMTWLTEISKHM